VHDVAFALFDEMAYKRKLSAESMEEFQRLAVVEHTQNSPNLQLDTLQTTINYLAELTKKDISLTCVFAGNLEELRSYIATQVATATGKVSNHSRLQIDRQLITLVTFEGGSALSQVRKIENVPIGSNNKPKLPITISQSGQM
jgi:hypothetical protein